MDSLQGQALVASPYLTDPNFLRSVIYLLQHDEEGAVGLILNRPTQANVGDLFKQLDEPGIDSEELVYWGGPVEGPLMLLQEVETPDGTGVFAASDQTHILDVYTVKAENPEMGRRRLFDGYAGWGPEQLDGENKSGGWLTWDISPDQIFEDPDDLWETALKTIGRDILAGGIDPSLLPEDPAFN